jgi:hypothetical protein
MPAAKRAPKAAKHAWPVSPCAHHVFPGAEMEHFARVARFERMKASEEHVQCTACGRWLWSDEWGVQPGLFDAVAPEVMR